MNLLLAKPISHIAVSGKTMYYLKVWKDKEDNIELVNVRKTTFEKLKKLYGVGNVQKGGGNVLDNNSKKR